MKSIPSLRLLSKRKRTIAVGLLLTFMAEILPVNEAMALTGGPGQPEMSSFEPVSTNQMVDLFTGDFTYNVPLMDVEGYPINIAYHGGAGMDQEASWVGLGWNINPGVINRSVRGFPDDFKGETITKNVNRKKNKDIMFGGGVTGELFGLDAVSLGGNLSWSNYTGFYLSPEASLGIEMDNGAKLSLSYSGKSGYNIGLSLSAQKEFDNSNTSATATAGVTYNSRSQSTTFSVSASLDYDKDQKKNQEIEKKNQTQQAELNKRMEGTGLEPIKLQPQPKQDMFQTNTLASAGSSTTIGDAAYLPSGRPSMVTRYGSFKATFGGEIFGVNPDVYVNGKYSESELANANASNKAYGYYYLQDRTDKDLTDFNRDSDPGTYNPTQKHLAPGYWAYDVLNISGQGASGSFRPFRNDLGSASDESFHVKASKGGSLGAEIGAGNTAKYGGNYTDFWATDDGGGWNASHLGKYKFGENKDGELFEHMYFKNAGELTPSNTSYYKSIGLDKPNKFVLNGIDGLKLGNYPAKNSYAKNAPVDRHARGKYISYLTADEAKHVGLNKTIDNDGTTINRDAGHRKGYHISEITHYEKNGNRYVYGIPAYNTAKKEVLFNASGLTRASDGTVTYSPGSDNSTSNTRGKDNLFSESSTPAYAHSYLLTSFLSGDYVDVTGNGVSDDDLGTAVKFNWKQIHSDYKWRSPMGVNKAMHSHGNLINKDDDKGSYTSGTKEVWYLKSIESRNLIAIFETDNSRNDAQGIDENGNPSSQKLPSLKYIKLYSKAEYLSNSSTAVPLKTVEFNYYPDNQGMCQNIPNAGAANRGKLTLKNIYMYYGTSNYGRQSPYEFEYNTYNPGYDRSKVDRWGRYKGENFKNGSGTELDYNSYPYVKQDAQESGLSIQQTQDKYASAWMLSDVKLPSGGKISMTYEADDYAYIQNKRAGQMFQVVGAGDGDQVDFSTNLYGGGAGQRSFIYVRLPNQFKTMNSAEKTAALDRMVKDIPYMYFQFYVDAGGRNGSEKVQGYAGIESYGFCTNNSSYTDDYAYIKVKKSQVKFRKLNPIVATSIHYLDANLKNYIGVGGSPNDNGFLNLAKQMFSMVTDLYALFAGPVNFYLTKGVAKKFDAYESVVRLNNPTGKKYGGGYRVKRIELNDGWDGLTGTAEDASTYGQEYSYVLEDGTSSGVASYEPLTGGDENPFRRPSFYMEKQEPLFATNWKIFQELPLGESLIPPGSVGYSRVVVKSIHQEDGSGNRKAKSAQHQTVSKFYTAKEFPFKYDFTPLQKDERKNKLAALTSLFGVGKNDRYAASQGYVFRLNDMHGKLKSTEYIVDVMDAQGNYQPTESTREEYHYKVKHETAETYALDNEVPVVSRLNGQVINSHMGQEIDLTIDTKYLEHQDGNPSISFNADGFFAGPIPILVPTGFSPGTNNTLVVRNVVTTKVIQEYGILEEVVKKDANREVKTRNELFDGHTGEVLLTSFTNEFDDQIYTYNEPAFWVEEFDRMGPAYLNHGYFQTAGKKINLLTACSSPEAREYMKGFLYKGLMDGLNWGYLNSIDGNLMKKNIFVPGDEVMVTNSSGAFQYKAWAISVLDQQDIRNLKANHVVSSSANITGSSTSDLIGPCADAYNQTQYENALMAATGYSRSQVDAFTQSLLTFGRQYDVCSLLKEFPVDMDDPNRFLTNGNLEDFTHLLDGDLCKFLRVLYRNQTPNNELRQLIGGLFGYSGINDQEKNMELFAAAMADQKMQDYLLCHMQYPAVLQFLNLLSCDQDLFDITRHVLKNENVLFDKHYTNNKNYDPNEPGSGGGGTTAGTNSVSVVDVFNITSNGCGMSLTHFPTTTDRIATNLSNPFVFEKLLSVKCEDRIQVGCESVDTIVTSGSTTVDIKNLIDTSGCKLFNGETFDATVNDVVIFMDQDGNLKNVDGLIVKIIRSGRRNMLEGVAAQTTLWNTDPINTLSAQWQVLGASATTFSEDWKAENKSNYAADNSVPNKTIANPYVYGIRGIFRPYENYVYNEKRTYTANLDLSEDGMYHAFSPYWTRDLLVLKKTDPIDDSWVKSATTTKYSVLGHALEEVDALDRYTSEVFGNHNMARVVAGNAQHREVAFEDFENYLTTNGDRMAHFDAVGQIESQYPSDACIISEKQAHTGKGSLYLSGRELSTGSWYEEIAPIVGGTPLTAVDADGVTHYYQSVSHTECNTTNVTCSLDVSLSQGANFLNEDYTNARFRPIPDKEYIISGWIKNAYPDKYVFVLNSNNNLVPKEFLPSAAVDVDVITSSGTTTFNCVANMDEVPVVNGWQRFMKTISLPVNTTSLKIKFDGGDYGSYFDDVRIYPADGSMVSYVYDHRYLRLNAQLDENNYATFFEYDAEGNLRRVKKETERGILMLKETKKHTRKIP